MNKQQIIADMLKLADRLNEIVAGMEERKANHACRNAPQGSLT